MRIYSQSMLLTLRCMKQLKEKNNKAVAIWLLIGAGMIVIQILIGGITRLTESGLSITEWNPVTGTLPPLNDMAWQVEFDKYRNTDQFRYVHQHFSLNDFKYIFFWEWFHRLWARLLGIVFLAGFLYFLVRRQFNKGMILPMIILFLLGGLQGAIGWLMVKSGLVPEKFYVGHVELTTHLIAALILLGYTLWFAYDLMPVMNKKVYNNSINTIVKMLGVLLLLQLIYGGFMAGLKAAPMAPTWPDINGRFIPVTINELHPWWKNLSNNPLTVHFIHRGIAYLLVVAIIYFLLVSKNIPGKIFIHFRKLLFALIVVQLLLGIITVINSTNPGLLVWLGVTHQFIAMLLVVCLVSLLYLVKRSPIKIIKQGG